MCCVYIGLKGGIPTAAASFHGFKKREMDFHHVSGTKE